MADVVENTTPKRKIGLAAILIPIAVLSVCGGALFSFSQYAVVSRVVATATGVPAQKASVTNEEGVVVDDAEESDEDDADGEAVTFGLFHEITGMTINPAGSGGSRYLLVNVALEAAEEETIAQIAEREFVVRDAMLAVMGAKTVPELADIAQRGALKDTLRMEINKVIDEGKVERFYFTQYVMQ